MCIPSDPNLNRGCSGSELDVARNLRDRGVIDSALKLLRIIGAARGRERNVRGIARAKSEAIVVYEIFMCKIEKKLLIILSFWSLEGQ